MSDRGQSKSRTRRSRLGRGGWLATVSLVLAGLVLILRN
jgi:hypothetical protein